MPHSTVSPHSLRNSKFMPTSGSDCHLPGFRAVTLNWAPVPRDAMIGREGQIRDDAPGNRYPFAAAPASRRPNNGVGLEDRAPAFQPLCDFGLIRLERAEDRKSVV